MATSDWVVTVVEVLGGSLTFGGVIAGFRTTRHRDALSGYKELVEMADRRHELDQEALHNKERQIDSLKSRVGSLESSMAQLQTVAEIATALRTMAESMNSFTVELALLKTHVIPPGGDDE